LDKKEKLYDWIKSLAIALVIALFIRAFIVEAFKIPSSSMEDTLLIGDHILVNRFVYGVRMPFSGATIIPVGTPKHGDIIVFRYPPKPSIYFIKRCIGTPGDVIEIKNKALFRNGKKINEPYAIHRDKQIYPRDTDYQMAKTLSGSRDNFGPIKVPPHSYFMMGDNRDNSYDSRYWGFVPEKNLTGKAFIIYGSWEFSPFVVRFNRFFRLVH
jgi:signal peptidase I